MGHVLLKRQPNAELFTIERFGVLDALGADNHMIYRRNRAGASRQGFRQRRPRVMFDAKRENASGCRGVPEDVLP